MLLAYLDESHAKGRNYYIGALVMAPENVPKLSTALDEVVWDAHSTFGVQPNAELHGHPLVQAKEDWAGMEKQVRGRIGVYGNALDAIAQHSEGFFIRGIHQPRFKERYSGSFDVHTAALTFIYEDLDTYAKSRDEYALCIADECSSQDGARTDLRWYQTYATWGYRARKIERIIDTCHFVPSRASRMVQAVDLVTYLYRRRWNHTETDERARAATDKLWSKVQGEVLGSRVWTP